MDFFGDLVTIVPSSERERTIETEVLVVPLWLSCSE